MNHFDPKRIVGLIASLPASGLESGNPHTAITGIIKLLGESRGLDELDGEQGWCGLCG